MNLPFLYQVAAIQGWTSAHTKEQNLLMHFLWLICKQQQLAHVWLTTSKESTKSWVTGGMTRVWGGKAMNSLLSGPEVLSSSPSALRIPVCAELGAGGLHMFAIRDLQVRATS
jgi:hypothetical protein